MQTPTRTRRTVARILTGSMLTTVALGLVAAPGMAEEVAPATPGPHTIPDSPVLGDDLVLPAPGDEVPSVPELLGELDELPEGYPVPEPPEFTCEEWREIFEAYPLPPWMEAPECPVEEGTDDEDGEPTFPIDEIPLPEDLDEIPVPFDPGEIPLPFPGGDDDSDETPEDPETSEPEDPEGDEGEAGSTPETEEDPEGPADADSGSGADDEGGEPEVGGTSTEAPSDDVEAAGSDDTPVPTRVDAGAGGSVLTIARRTLVLVAAAVLALGLVTAGGIMLARSTDR